MPSDDASRTRVPPRSQTAIVNGVRLHYRVYDAQSDAAAGIDSAQPSVMMLHGWPQTCHIWHRVAPELTARGRTVITPDLRGLGESDRTESGYDVRNVAEDIHQLVASLGLKQIDLVGHDVGAWVGYAYASAFPNEVRRLVLTEASLPGLSAEPGALVSTMVNIKTWHFPFNTLPDLPEALVTGREEIYLRWLFENKAFSAGAVAADDVAVYTRAYQQPGAMTAGFAYYRAIFDSIRQNRESAQAKLAMPVMAVGGESGVGATLFETVRSVALSARGAVLPGCGHYVPDEQPLQFATLVNAFLESEASALHCDSVKADHSGD